MACAAMAKPISTVWLAQYGVVNDGPGIEMPHAELKYSTDLDIDPNEILAEIETVILEHDTDAGDCKGRGYPTSHYHHSHIHVSVALLAKAHRDEKFFKALSGALETRIKQMIPIPCYFSLGLEILPALYVAGPYEP